MTSWETLHFQQDGPVATVTLNRPTALNALNAAMLRELDALFAHLREAASVRVILLTGAGDRAFAAGADIRELANVDAISGKAVAESGQQVFSRIERCGKPVIACLNGLALGGGLELALACTFRLADDRAQLGLPEAKLGLIPGFGGAYRLTRLVGRSAALRMMLTAETLTAAEALRIGLIDEIQPAATLLHRGHALAATIASLAPLAIRALLELDQREAGLADEAAYALEAELFANLCSSADKNEGIAAFLQKRKPDWQSK